MSRIRDLIVPGSIRVKTVTWDRMLVTLRCGRCGHEQEVRAECHTTRCTACGRVMRLDQAASAANVVPLRRA